MINRDNNGRFVKGKPAWNKGLAKNKQPFFGKKLSIEHKNSLLKSHLGKSHSKNTKKKMSDNAKERLKDPIKNPNWKGGLTKKRNKIMNSNKYKEWRKQVFERDDYTCQDCNKRGGYIEAHHTIPVSKCIKLDCEKLIYDVYNGMTLCLECHKRTF